MKLKVIEYFWAVGRKTKRVKTIRVPLIVGPIKHFGDGCMWQIDEVNETNVKVSVVRRDGKIMKQFIIEKGKKNYWRPRSMDAGNEYVMQLVHFF